MEKLKEFEKLTLPDERQKIFLMEDSDSGKYRAITLQDIYQNVSDIKLHDSVPEVIRTHFATAQNLLVYSWFFYPFNVTAQFLAYVTVEFALKQLFKPQKKTSFRELVKMAIDHGLVIDEGFSHISKRTELDEYIDLEVGIEFQDVKNYTETLIETMPYLRNELAHGSFMLSSDGATGVRICAEFINQLFPEKTANVVPRDEIPIGGAPKLKR